MRSKMVATNLVIPKLGLIGLAWVKANLWPSHCGQKCPTGPCVHLWRQEWVTAIESQMFPKRKKFLLFIPSRKGIMKTGQGKFNLSTIDLMILLLHWVSNLTGKGTHTLDFPFPQRGFFFLKWIRQAILFQSVWIKQTVPIPSWENIRKEPNVTDCS